MQVVFFSGGCRTTRFSWTSRTNWKKSRFICLIYEFIRFITDFFIRDKVEELEEKVKKVSKVSRLVEFIEEKKVNFQKL
jgi:hypothetical protein